MTPPRSPEIRWAAMQAVAQHLGGFQDSTAAEDLWENNPELTEAEMEVATKFAEELADNTRNALLDGFAIMKEETE